MKYRIERKMARRKNARNGVKTGYKRHLSVEYNYIECDYNFTVR